MKSLIENYIDKLDIDTFKYFIDKKSIILDKKEIDFLFNLVKSNSYNLLLNDTFYLDIIKNNINESSYLKIKDLYYFYKNKYKGYLF